VHVAVAYQLLGKIDEIVEILRERKK